MSATDHLNELQFSLHRGINTSYPHYSAEGNPVQYQLEKGNLGTHWSADEGVAQEFANHPNSRSLSPSWRTNYAHIIHAEIPMSSVETHPETMRQGGYANFGGADPHDEKEIMVQKGAPIKVTGKTSLRQSGETIKSRKRTYNPPREMKA